MTPTVLPQPPPAKTAASKWHDERLPESLVQPVSIDEVNEAGMWLDVRCEQHSTPTIGLLLKTTDHVFRRISSENLEPWRRHESLRESGESACRIVREAIESIDGKLSAWSDFTCLPDVHSCVLRRPVDSLRRLLDLLRVRRLPVAGIFLDEPVANPDSRVTANGGKRKSSVDELFDRLSEQPTSYLRALGQSWFDGPLSDFTGAGRRVCVLDSGADESHVALRGRLAYHSIIDQFGQEKDAKYSVDRGCHGTKTAGIVCARRVARRDLGLKGDAPVQLGVAPDAQVVTISVLQGECTQECGSIAQILGGLNAAVRNRFDREWGGYECVVLSIELSNPNFAPRVSSRIDDALQTLRANGLLPLLAAGNAGPVQVRLGSKGVYIGAVDRGGRLWEHSSPDYDLLAPGVSVACCQPSVAQLNYASVGVYSGTSLAAPFVAGVVSVLQQATSAPAVDCVDALQATSQEGVIDPEAAFQALTWR